MSGGRKRLRGNSAGSDPGRSYSFHQENQKTKSMRNRCQKFDLICQYDMPEDEELVYAGFLSDQNPSFILMMSNCKKDSCSYLSLGKLQATNLIDEEHSEQILKVKLSNKIAYPGNEKYL